jgi:membrane associated rhomboid family serine protease
MFPLGDDNSQRETTPYVVWTLIGVNVLFWLAQLGIGESFTYGWAAIPFEITRNVDLVHAQMVEFAGQTLEIPQAPGPVPIHITLLTAMFMHGSWMHIIGNMLYLAIFGDQIEDILGHGRFILFYLLCGIGASLAHVAFASNSVIPSLGASGAIAGVLGAYLVKYPRNPVRVLVVRAIVVMPAFVVLGFWIVLQLISQVTVGLGASTGVAYMAHIGGFAAGVVLIFLMAIGRPPRVPARQKVMRLSRRR